MESPEKLYTDSNGNNLMPKRYCEGDVEYVRTDVFIEKALKWYCLDCECCEFNDNCTTNQKCVFKDFFERYLKGNDKAFPPKIGNAFNPDGSATENYRYRHIIKRTQDDLINKACEWLQKNASNYAFVDTDKIGNVADIDSLLVQDFKKYMKGNKI